MELKFEPIVSKRRNVEKEDRVRRIKQEKYIGMGLVCAALVTSGVLTIKLPPEAQAGEVVEVIESVGDISTENVSEDVQTVEPFEVSDEIDIVTVIDDEFINTVTEEYKEVAEKEALYTAKKRDEMGLSVNVSTEPVVAEDEIKVLTEEEVTQKETYMKVDSMTVTNINDVPVTTGYVFGTGPLTEKYSYALYDTGGRRTDLDEYLLNVLEDSCEENGVNPHVMLGIIMTESEGHANAKNKNSSATGLCQFLSSSGKWTYEVLLGNGTGTYTHDMAYNPEINIRMGAAAMGYWLKTKGNYYNAIQAYRGKNDISGYTSVINSHIGKVGLKVEDFY